MGRYGGVLDWIDLHQTSYDSFDYGTTHPDPLETLFILRTPPIPNQTGFFCIYICTYGVLYSTVLTSTVHALGHYKKGSLAGTSSELAAEVLTVKSVGPSQHFLVTSQRQER